MRLLPNQPIVFDFPQTGPFPANYRQIINRGDKTNYQFRVDACAGTPQVLDNNTFFASSGWVIGGTGWVLGTGEAIKSSNTPSNLKQPGLIIGKFYCF